MDKTFEKIVLGLATLLGLSFLLKKKTPTVSAVAPVVKPSKELSDREKLVSLAMRETGLPREELVVRGLIPSDLSLTTWNFDVTANSQNTLISTSVPDQTYILLEGVSYAGDSITELRLSGGASLREIWSIQFVPLTENKIWYDPTPTAVRANQSINVSAYSTKTTVGDSLSLIGTTVQRRGITTA